MVSIEAGETTPGTDSLLFVVEMAAGRLALGMAMPLLLVVNAADRIGAAGWLGTMPERTLLGATTLLLKEVIAAAGRLVSRADPPV